jgi:hypothetical protein
MAFALEGIALWCDMLPAKQHLIAHTSHTLATLLTSYLLQEVERERDEAAQQLESRTRQLERLQREWMLEKQGLEVSACSASQVVLAG